MPRNYDPELHPFQEGREYVRALNATKLSKASTVALNGLSSLPQLLREIVKAYKELLENNEN